uniref:Serine/threonine-protein phosphatase 2A 55 kDa regulatory subunit B n=1 Tax=Mesocestoides corti TaxID=53468 RepID=A0A5K3FPM0_MESCO
MMMNGQAGVTEQGQIGNTPTWYYDDVKVACDDSGIEADHLSCVQFDGSGNFLAVGDRGGKITVYRTSKQTTKYENPVYETYCSFTSHESEFDYLKSLEIEEKINKIRWLPQQSQARHLLSTNGFIMSEARILHWRT